MSFYTFDNYGWYTATVANATDRSTPIDPVNQSLTTTDGVLRANWTGLKWVDRPYWTPAPVSVDPFSDGRITAIAFRERFTQVERTDLEMAMRDLTTDTNNQRKTAAKLRWNLYDQGVSTYINLNKSRIRDWVTDLGVAGIITPARASEIINAPITDHELYVQREDAS